MRPKIGPRLKPHRAPNSRRPKRAFRNRTKTLYDVKVNGVPAEIDGETFSADIVLENEGPNTVTAVARDCVGYSSQHAITVIRDLPVSVAITDVQFSPRSTDELLLVKVLGTVDEPVVYIRGKNETHPTYRLGNQTFTNEVVGESAGGTFTIDGIVVFPGINILSVAARDAKGRWGEAEVVVEVTAEEGAYGEGQNPEPPYCILSVSVGGEGGEGGGEKLAGGESFMTFGTLGEKGGQVSLTIEESSDDINVFVATDLRFTAQASACNAEIASATLDLGECEGHLAIFNNGNGNAEDTVSKDTTPFEGFWWDVDAASVGRWKNVRANATLRDVTTGAPLSAGPSNPFSGNNDAVKQIIDFKVVNDADGWILESGTDSYKVLIVGKPEAGSTTHTIQVQAKAVTELGLLASQVSWYKKCKEETKFLGTGETFQWTLVAEESTADITAFGNAPNAKEGNGPQGPLKNDKVTGYPKPEPQAGESTSTIKVDGGIAMIVIDPKTFHVGTRGTAELKLTCFDSTTAPPQPEGWYVAEHGLNIVRIEGGHNHAGETKVPLIGISEGTAIVECVLKLPSTTSGSTASGIQGDDSDKAEAALLQAGTSAARQAEAGEPPPKKPLAPKVTAPVPVDDGKPVRFKDGPPERLLVMGCLARKDDSGNAAYALSRPVTAVAESPAGVTKFAWGHECMTPKTIDTKASALGSGKYESELKNAQGQCPDMKTPSGRDILKVEVPGVGAAEAKVTITRPFHAQPRSGRHLSNQSWRDFVAQDLKRTTPPSVKEFGDYSTNFTKTDTEAKTEIKSQKDRDLRDKLRRRCTEASATGLELEIGGELVNLSQPGAGDLGPYYWAGYFEWQIRDQEGRPVGESFWHGSDVYVREGIKFKYAERYCQPAGKEEDEGPRTPATVKRWRMKEPKRNDILVDKMKLGIKLTRPLAEIPAGTKLVTFTEPKKMHVWWGSVGRTDGGSFEQELTYPGRFEVVVQESPGGGKTIVGSYVGVGWE